MSDGTAAVGIMTVGELKVAGIIVTPGAPFFHIDFIDTQSLETTGVIVEVE